MHPRGFPITVSWEKKDWTNRSGASLFAGSSIPSTAPPITSTDSPTMPSRLAWRETGKWKSVSFSTRLGMKLSLRRGGGAQLNGRPVRPSAVKELAKAFVVASLPSAVDVRDPSVVRLLHVLPRAQTLQRTGSAALNLAYVACGRIDAFWSSSLKPWDVAAGSLIVTEAGGTISRMAGEPFDVMLPDLLSSNGSAIHSELRKLLTARINNC